MPKTTKHGTYGIYLLGMMFKVMGEGNSNMAKSQLFDQCKTMFIMNDNLTSLLTIWIVIILAIHPNQQK
jgi:hypothetical protein